jgi:competence protein ComEA
MKKLCGFLAMAVCLSMAAPMMVQPVLAAAEATAATAAAININTASGEQLQDLPGIGQVVAERIIAYRTENGSFASADDLLKVKGIGVATLEKIRGRIVVQ